MGNDELKRLFQEVQGCQIEQLNRMMALKAMFDAILTAPILKCCLWSRRPTNRERPIGCRHSAAVAATRCVESMVRAMPMYAASGQNSTSVDFVCLPPAMW
jgi:hypothetical protein